MTAIALHSARQGRLRPSFFFCLLGCGFGLGLAAAALAQQPVYLGDVGFDDLATGDVLKDNVGVGEVVLAIGDYGKIAAVVLI